MLLDVRNKKTKTSRTTNIFFFLFESRNRFCLFRCRVWYICCRVSICTWKLRFFFFWKDTRLFFFLKPNFFLRFSIIANPNFFDTKILGANGQGEYCLVGNTWRFKFCRLGDKVSSVSLITMTALSKKYFRQVSILGTVMPLDTRPQLARTLTMHVFDEDTKKFEMNEFM